MQIFTQKFVANNEVEEKPYLVVTPDRDFSLARTGYSIVLKVYDEASEIISYVVVRNEEHLLKVILKINNNAIKESEFYLK